MSSVRSATSAAHRVPSHGNRRPSAAGAPLQSGAAIPGSQHCHRPKGPLAHTPHSSAPGGLAMGMLCHSGAAVPLALPHDHRVRTASPCQTHPVEVAGNSPVYGPGWEFPLVVAQGVAGKPGLFLPGRTVYFCPFQPGVQQDDALRLRQGLGERAGGQESGPAGGAAGPRRLLPGKYQSRRSQRGQERPRRPFGTVGPGGRGGHPGGHPHRLP